MLPGFYSSAAGMMSQIDRHEAIANNLANVSTPGFKRSSVAIDSFSTRLQNAQSDNAGSVIPRAVLFQDERQGPVQITGSPTNFTIDGAGYFVTQTEHGEELVRAGNFRLDETGRLINHDGSPVLGQEGPIQVTGTDWHIDSEGAVHSNGEVVDRLRIAGNQNPDSPDDMRLLLGKLEASNVNAVEEMVSMIAAIRSYEACQKAISSLDQILDSAINHMGRNA